MNTMNEILDMACEECINIDCAECGVRLLRKKNKEIRRLEILCQPTEKK